MMSTAWCPSSWNWRSLRSGTVCPRWTSMPVGSMPYLTRSGLPVLTLRSSFLRSSSSFSICATPRRIRASCSSTGFMTDPSTVHLKPTHRLKSMRGVDDLRFTLVRGPGERQDVEAGGVTQQMVLLQEVQGELRQAFLLGLIDRRGGADGVAALGGAHLDEDDAAAVERHEVQFPAGARVVAGD